MIFRALRLSAAVLLLSLNTVSAQQPAERGWPREIAIDGAKLVLYQPQPEELKGTTLKARAAASFTRPGKEPIFGALWLTAKVETDRDTRVSLIRDVDVTKIRWPNARPEIQDSISRVIERDFPKEGFHISLDRLTSSLATAEREQQSLAGFKNDPPKIVFTETKSVLLLYDGEPKTSKIENSSFERVVNSPMGVVKRHPQRHLVSLRRQVLVFGDVGKRDRGCRNRGRPRIYSGWCPRTPPPRRRPQCRQQWS